MSAAVVHLLYVLGGVAVALGTMWWFAYVRGGWMSRAGVLHIVLLLIGAALILIGFGVLTMPGGVL